MNYKNINLNDQWWAGRIACETTNAYKNLEGKPEGKRPPRKPRRRW